MTGMPVATSFILILEIMLRQIQKDERIKGLQYRGFNYKYRAFANDVLFIVEDPETSLPELLERIKSFGELEGFYINRNKSNM